MRCSPLIQSAGTNLRLFSSILKHHQTFSNHVLHDGPIPTGQCPDEETELTKVIWSGLELPPNTLKRWLSRRHVLLQQGLAVESKSADQVMLTSRRRRHGTGVAKTSPAVTIASSTSTKVKRLLSAHYPKGGLGRGPLGPPDSEENKRGRRDKIHALAAHNMVDADFVVI
ncbi:unnamed protein product [Protopolystoma xenopodis]|uniref:Uncharacterized protein n=1 Tax=Protopolystoma xenopodis TaxID=117903 RepID=A0A448WWS9_9PLAT|nr:unnamed protein product [Protopolystoma xenopodis]